jgi:DNA-binding NtrC family response regulator
MSSQKILVVDDDISVSTALKIALEDRYDVATKCKVDLVFLEIKMPKINGIEALREIKRNHPEIKVIMLTAFASEDNIQKVKTLGAYGFISKPFVVHELQSCVERVLSQN